MRFRPTAVLPNSGQFIAQDAWNGVALYRLNDLSLVYSFRVEASVGGFAVTPDEGILLLGCSDGSLSAWDLSTGQKLWAIHSSPNAPSDVQDVCCSHDGLSVVASGRYGQVQVFAVGTGQLLGTVQFPQGSVMSAALSPDGVRGVLVTDSQKLIAFDVATGQTQDTGIQGAWPVRYSVDGKYVALRSDNDWGVHLRVVKTDGWAIQDFADFRKPDPIQPTADGGFLVTTRVGYDTVGVRWRPGSKELEELWRLPSHTVEHERMSFDPDRRIGVRTDHGLVTEVVDLTTGDVLGSIDNRANLSRPNPRDWMDMAANVILGAFVTSWAALWLRRVVKGLRSAPKPDPTEPISSRPDAPSSSICVRLPDR
jgi:WD40 repeat protein